MGQVRLEKEWIFNFAIESPHEEALPGSFPQALLLKILEWVEEQDIQMGGSYQAASTLDSAAWAEIQELVASWASSEEVAMPIPAKLLNLAGIGRQAIRSSAKRGTTALISMAEKAGLEAVSSGTHLRAMDPQSGRIIPIPHTAKSPHTRRAIANDIIDIAKGDRDDSGPT